MENIIISSEATCDLPKELIEKYDIKVIDMDFIINGDAYSTANNTVTSTNLYQKMKNGIRTSTSQVNIQTYEDFFTTQLEYGNVLHIAFSSGLSDTYKSAVTASKIVNEKSDKYKVYVIDSLCACSGQGLLAILSKIYSKKTKNIHKLIDFVENLKLNINHIFTVDNLKYLANGGRIKQSTALIGNLINIKPVMRMDANGHLVIQNKVLCRKKALQALSNKLIESIDSKSDIIFISHANCINDAEICAQRIEESTNIKPIITDLGPVIGSHSGPGTLAIFFVGTSR